MKRLLVVGLIGFLAACGAEGDPLRPTANLGLNIGPNGVTPSMGLGAQNSNVRLNIGL